MTAVEKEARGKSPEERVALRQELAKPLFDDLEIWLHAQLPKISGKSPLAQAIRYALGRMPKARSYLDHGCLEADNNTAERAVIQTALRPSALWREAISTHMPSRSRLEAPIIIPNLQSRDRCQRANGTSGTAREDL